uniref:Uncharacterized protein n=1 Tax=Myoviridae sp. ctLYp5 TaxID=2827680 RepID=A0A8S5SWS8_9CAUD|nr:MAG TPA: hypothetical protein [Myoviridae sp. ctLYp5]DAS58671.1 MAG TPA: hypothetical protein [Caudoviricetes sp.]DAS68618.1 MAG TPA: hypothetical protein [Caudoviricetes sp.]
MRPSERVMWANPTSLFERLKKRKPPNRGLAVRSG